MGYGDSSAQLGGHNEVFNARSRSAEAVAFEVAGQKRCGIDSGAKPLASWILLALVRSYIIFLSPFFGGACKFYPSCSNYAYEAIAQHGARRGLIFAMKRLGRCRPFTQGGFDPVPDAGHEYPANNSPGIDPHLALQGQRGRPQEWKL